MIVFQFLSALDSKGMSGLKVLSHRPRRKSASFTRSGVPADLACRATHQSLGTLDRFSITVNLFVSNKPSLSKDFTTLRLRHDDCNPSSTKGRSKFGLTKIFPLVELRVLKMITRDQFVDNAGDVIRDQYDRVSTEAKKGLDYVTEPAKDLVGLLQDYAKSRPEVAAVWCFGLGLFIGWKLRR